MDWPYIHLPRQVLIFLSSRFLPPLINQSNTPAQLLARGGFHHTRFVLRVTLHAQHEHQVVHRLRCRLVIQKVAMSHSGFWIAFLVTLPLLVWEMIEDWSNLFPLDPDFVREALFLLALPLAVGLGLSWLKRHESRLARISALFPRKTSPVNRQRVLVVEDSLFGELVKSLLNRVKDLNIVGFAPRNEAELVEEIKRTRPAVVVLDAATQLTDPDSLVSLLDEKQDLRVVAMSADDNTVRVHAKQRVLITCGEDLASIIRSWFQA